MGGSASVVTARLEAEYGDEVKTWKWSDEMRDTAIASITKTYESVLATTASPEEAYEAIKTEYLAAKRRAAASKKISKLIRPSLTTQLSAEGHARLKGLLAASLPGHAGGGAAAGGGGGGGGGNGGGAAAASAKGADAKVEPAKAAGKEKSPTTKGKFPMDHDDGGLAVVRVKPLGAGGGGIEKSASSGVAGVEKTSKGVRVIGGVREKLYRYPKHIIAPAMTQAAVYAMFMPQRVAAFLNGINVNIMCYGQTGSGKTHTMFGPPGLMDKAAAGAFGADASPDYGLCPRGLLDIVGQLRAKKAAGDPLKYLLTASSVELTMTQGNLDMFMKSKNTLAKVKMWGDSGRAGVSLDKTTKPPQLFGMVEVPIESAEDLLTVFKAVASRNTSGTGLNDSSSRSHCFMFLKLYAFNPATQTIRTSRFQFVDLAGSERLKDAHFGVAQTTENMGAIEGLCTNFSLMMLSQRLREVVSAVKAGKSQKVLIQRSFKMQNEVDLIPLLSESMTGVALSMIIVCVSSAMDNCSQSINALNFGQVFGGLRTEPKPQPFIPVKRFTAWANKLVKAGRNIATGGNPKYARMRRTQGKFGQQQLEILKALMAGK